MDRQKLFYESRATDGGTDGAVGFHFASLFAFFSFFSIAIGDLVFCFEFYSGWLLSWRADSGGYTPRE